jgi:CRP-like cAMP-binding protein
MYVTLPTEHTAAVTATAPLSKTCLSFPETRLKTGSYLYYEGDNVDWLYQVTSGVVRLTRLLSNGRRQVISFGFPGDIVGFPSAGDHHTDCDALVDTRLRPYRRKCLESSTCDAPLHRALLQAALREISAMQDHFMMLGRKSAAEKVASFLNVMSERVGDDMGVHTCFALPMNRSDIADFLGLTTETVSRTLTQLRKSKIIEIENIHTIVVLRPTALLGLSQGDDG